MAVKKSGEDVNTLKDKFHKDEVDARVRATLPYTDGWHNRFHIDAPFSLISDPNGICKCGDTYHIFCQWNPVPQNQNWHKNKSWMHTTTKDFINYTMPELSLWPSDIYDKDGCHSGCGFVEDGKLLMDKILERFAVHFNDIYGGNDIEFKDEEGRRFFMLYIRPIINGTGNYYIEAETRDRSRTDMIIDYLGTQYVIEMKIWRGDAYNTRGEKQLTEYLDFYHVNKGYMLSFNFNKSSKVSGSKTMQFGDKEIFEVVV